MFSQEMHDSGVVQMWGEHLQQPRELHGVLRDVEGDGLVVYLGVAHFLHAVEEGLLVERGGTEGTEGEKEGRREGGKEVRRGRRIVRGGVCYATSGSGWAIERGILKGWG